LRLPCWSVCNSFFLPNGISPRRRLDRSDSLALLPICVRVRRCILDALEKRKHNNKNAQQTRTPSRNAPRHESGTECHQKTLSCKEAITQTYRCGELRAAASRALRLVSTSAFKLCCCCCWLLKSHWTGVRSHGSWAGSVIVTFLGRSPSPSPSPYFPAW
jgi:hypothetical protein